MNGFALRPHVPVAAVLLCALAISGCAKKTMVTPPQAASPPPAAAHTAPMPAPAPVPAPAPTAALTAGDFKDAYFEFDKSDLQEAARTALDADAKLLRDHPKADIRIEGHCDERGTVEYNQALGDRRARAAQDYLEAAGASASQIETISYGKDRPFCTEHEESCWARNRCDHLVLKPNPA